MAYTVLSVCEDIEKVLSVWTTLSTMEKCKCVILWIDVISKDEGKTDKVVTMLEAVVSDLTPVLLEQIVNKMMSKSSIPAAVHARLQSLYA